MNKYEFLALLSNRLAGLRQEDVRRWCDYYSEMIDDRLEDGMSEEEAVIDLGSLDEIVTQILQDTPTSVAAVPIEQKARPNRKPKAWEILLLILGAPLWIVLLAAAIIVLLAVYIVLWSVVVSLYAVNIALAACAVAGIFGSPAFFLAGNPLEGAVFFGGGLACAGLAIFMFLGCRATVKAMVWLSKKIWQGVKACFVRKGDAK